MSGKLPVALLSFAILLGGGLPVVAEPAQLSASVSEDHYRPRSHRHGRRVIVRHHVHGRSARVLVVRRPVTAAPWWVVRAPVVVQWERTVIDDADVDSVESEDLDSSTSPTESDDLDEGELDGADGLGESGDNETEYVPDGGEEENGYVFQNEEDTWRELERMEAEDDSGEDAGAEVPAAPNPGVNPPAAIPPSLPGPPGSSAAVPQPIAPADAASAVFLADMEQQILELVNRERAAAGAAALTNDPLLTVAARRHSREMAEVGFFSHDSPTDTNRTLGMRLANAGLSSYGWSGENIALSTSASAEGFVRMWMDSPGHRENLLRPEFKFSGIGVYTDGHKTWATHDFSSSH